jgi:glycosyltransferase involved in cell wall biosynthesis
MEKISGVQVWRNFVGPYIKGLHEFFYLVSFAWHLISRRCEYDIIHTFQVNLSTLVAILLASIFDKTVVATAHCSGGSGDVSLWRKIPFGKYMLKYVASYIHGCTAVSKEVLKELLDAGFFRKRTWYVPNGVVVRKLASSRIPSVFKKEAKGKIVAVFAGRISAQKAPALLLNAWAEALKQCQGMHLIMVGDGDLRSRMQLQVRELGIENHVTFTGWVDNVQTYFENADFFLLPSRHEGMPMALLEAMAAGLPAVASNVGGVGDVIEHEKNGLLFESGDIDALIKHVVALSVSSSLRKTLGRQAKKMVENGFDLNHSCRRYIKFYNAVLAK